MPAVPVAGNKTARIRHVVPLPKALGCLALLCLYASSMTPLFVSGACVPAAFMPTYYATSGHMYSFVPENATMMFDGPGHESTNTVEEMKLLGVSDQQSSSTSYTDTTAGHQEENSTKHPSETFNSPLSEIWTFSDATGTSSLLAGTHSAPGVGEKNATMDWKFYQHVDVIYRWMENLAATHPYVTVQTIGETFLKKPIKVMVVNHGGSKERVLVDAGTHSREWMSIAACTRLMHAVVHAFHRFHDFLGAFEWHFLPLINPDGYDYSLTTDKYWRKTRSWSQDLEKSFNASGLEGRCTGVDANRNFKFQWKESTGGEEARCAEDYSGPWPESEPCVQAFTKYFLQLSNTGNILAYFNLHTYGRMWLTPYASTAEVPADIAALTSVAQAGADAIEKVMGSRYTVGSAKSMLYSAHGTALDWAYSTGHVRFAYTLELGSAEGAFWPPTQEIEKVGAELFAGVTGSLLQVIQAFPTSQSWATDDGRF